MDIDKTTKILQALKSPPQMKNKLHEGDKVKIDIEQYRPQKDSKSITEVFWKFMEDNKDTVFTLVKHNKLNVLWGIKEDPRWLLYGDFLIRVD